MRWKFVVPFVVGVLWGLAIPAIAQVTYSAQEEALPFTVGVGVSDFLDDWGTRDPRQAGITLWADWRLPFVPPVLRGLGIEFEGRDLNWGVPNYLAGHRMDTALGGPVYEWRRKGRVRPFGKFVLGVGSIDFPALGSSYSHDTRTVFEPGGGGEVRLWKEFSVRGEYDYQFWRQIFGRNDLNPQGFTIGAAYDFGRSTGQ